MAEAPTSDRRLTRGGFFIVIHFPWGEKPMVHDDGDGDPKVSRFTTADEARKVAMQSRAVVAYGAEIFEIGTGDPV